MDSSEGIRPLNQKVQVVMDFPQPPTHHNLREFLGLINFYHRFIPHCAYIQSHWGPIAYFSKTLKPAETRYSTFDRQLLAIYLSLKHFRHFLEGRVFHVLTDHKPLKFTLSARPDRYTPRQTRQLDVISQYI